MGELQVKDLMVQRVATVNATTPVRVAIDAFSAHSFHHLPVVDSAGAPIGVLSDRDLLRVCQEGNLDPDESVGSVMTTYLACVEPEVSVVDAARRLVDLGLNCLLVKHPDGRLRGVLTTRDLARAVAEGKLK